MKRLCLAFAVWIVGGQLAVAEDVAAANTAPANPSPSPVPQPQQIPASAPNAAEAPRWDAAPASSAAVSASDQFNFNPSNPLGSGSNAISTADAAAAPASETTPETLQPKPLQSIMKRRSAAAPQGAGVLPATYDAPLATSGTSAIPAASVGGNVLLPQPVAVGSNPPGFLPIVRAGGISPATVPGASPIRGGSAPSTTPPAAPPNRESTIDPEKSAAARAAGDLLASSIDSRTAAITPLRLLDVLTQTAESERIAAIREYWNLARAWSDYQWSIDEAKRLDTIGPSRISVDAPMLSTARAAAIARMNDAQLNVESAQAALTRTARLAAQSQAYFPTDAPLVGPYQTYYSVLFAGRAAPGRTWQLDRMLPMRLKSINDRTAAVQSATSAVHYAEEAHAKGEADMRTVLACHDELHAERRAFLNAVNDYNVEIAEYAATVGGAVAPDRLVVMLIHVKPADRVSAVPVRATGAAPTATSSGGIANPAPSASGTGRNPTVGRTAAPAAGDGWVPSTQRSTESGVPQSSQTPNTGTVLPRPNGTQSDPFSPAR